jgi:hypothetical protein
MSTGDIPGPETTSKPANDAYTGMLLVSLAALVLGCVFLFLEFNQYPKTVPDYKDTISKSQAGRGEGGEQPPPPQPQP